jgi:hypothetical protein
MKKCMWGSLNMKSVTFLIREDLLLTVRDRLHGLGEGACHGRSIAIFTMRVSRRFGTSCASIFLM